MFSLSYTYFVFWYGIASDTCVWAQRIPCLNKVYLLSYLQIKLDWYVYRCYIFFCLSSPIVPASVTNISNSIVVKEGQNVTLVCHGSGLPAPSITWSDAWDVVMEDENIWHLQDINRNMAGQYSCTASNACGNDNRKVDIDVQCESLSALKHILQAVVCTSWALIGHIYQLFLFCVVFLPELPKLCTQRR